MSYEYTKPFEFAIKQIEEGSGNFEGYASIFGGPPDLQGDIVRKGAFADTLQQSKGRVPILMGHQMGRIVGFGLEAEEDNKGLRVAGQFTLDSDEGRNAYAIAKHASKCGHKLGLSIGYMVRPDGSELNERTGIRTLTAVDLYEYSIAATPAAPRARIAAVKAAAGEMTIREFEEFLRESGFSKDAACAIASRGFKAVDRRDAGEGLVAARDIMAALYSKQFQLIKGL